MTINSFEAAKKIINLSGNSVTNLKLQKILYLSHMVYLIEHRQPLVKEAFEAWDYGPVLPSVYHRLKIFGANPVQDRFYEANLIEGTQEANILEKAWQSLAPKEGWELVHMTHRTGGAWANNFEPGSNKIIPNTDIEKEYRTLYGN